MEEARDKNIGGMYSLEELVNSLEKPRKIILMVKAGKAVDEMISQPLPLISSGDLLMDGGNSNYIDTMERSKRLEAENIYYLGTGISGGEEGARNGPAIMPGGSPEAYEMMQKILTDIAAKVGGDACSTISVRTVQDISSRWSIMELSMLICKLIVEAYAILKRILGITPPDFHEIFTEWNKGELNSYLIEITADVFKRRTPRPVIIW